MRVINYKPPTGVTVGGACVLMLANAIVKRAVVRCVFNGVKMQASPKTSLHTLFWHYTNERSRRASVVVSPEEREAINKAKAEAHINGLVAHMLTTPKAIQACVDSGMNALVLLMKKLAEFQSPVPDYGAVADALEAAGYSEADASDYEKTRQSLGRFILGNCIACFRMHIPPMKVAIGFCDEYANLPDAPVKA